MAKNDLLRRRLIDEEGIELEAYQDSVKRLWHIGIGHNCDVPQSDEELEAMGLDEEPDNWEGITITEEQAYTLFDIDVREAIEDIYPFFTDEQLEELGETRRAVILEMTFQQGAAGVRKYKNFKAAILAEDWKKASHEMKTGSKGGPSKWMQQTPKRCKSAAEAMEKGYFERYKKEDEAPLLADAKSDMADYTESELVKRLQDITSELQRRFG